MPRTGLEAPNRGSVLWCALPALSQGGTFPTIGNVHHRINSESVPVLLMI